MTFEIYSHDWFITALDTSIMKYHQIHNDYEELTKLYESNKSNIWVGHNNHHYDDILIRAMLLRYSPEKIKEMSGEIIQDKGHIIMRQYNLYQVKLHSIDMMMDGMHLSLKEIEGYFKMKIQECDVSFDLDRKLTDEEIASVFEYNKHDVYATYKELQVFMPKIKSKLTLIKEYKLPLDYLGKTNASICARILQAKRNNFHDGTLPYDMSTAPIKIDKYKECVDFFTKCEDITKIGSLKLDIANTPHILAIGGLHGAIPKFAYFNELWLVDVASYYPNMMINFNLCPRSIPSPSIFKELIDKRLKAKKLAKSLEKGTPEWSYQQSMNEALKLPINTVSGCMKAKFSDLYDERNNSWMCITGQLLLVDLIEKLEPYCRLVQSNTDGLVIIPYNKKRCDEEIKNWEVKTGLILEKTIAKAIVQKDVNNYILLDDHDKVKVKGTFVKLYGYHNVEDDVGRRCIEVVDNAIVDFMLYGTPLEEFIGNKDNGLILYQMIKKTGSMYGETKITVDGKEVILPQRTNRYFASKRPNCGSAKKYKPSTGTWAKIEAVSDNCEVWNDSIEEYTLGTSPIDIDLDWYIQVAKSRVVDFVVPNNMKTRGKNIDLNEDFNTATKILDDERRRYNFV